jgi:hypothetical protein
MKLQVLRRFQKRSSPWLSLSPYDVVPLVDGIYKLKGGKVVWGTHLEGASGVVVKEWGGEYLG